MHGGGGGRDEGGVEGKAKIAISSKTAIISWALQKEYPTRLIA
jgi:hypothetical protein